MEEWCCSWSVDVGGVVLTIVSGCWWSVDAGEVVFLMVSGY